MFHDRPTCARSRSRCSRPKRGRPKVPFSACRCHIFVIDYRWGSMGSNETATATTGGPRVIDVFYGNGTPSGPNCTLLSGVDQLPVASRGRSGGGESPAPHTPALGPTEGSGSHCQVIHARMAWSAERIGRLSSKRRRMRCRRLTMYSYDPKRPQGSLWTTNGQGSTGAAAKAHNRIGSRELKKLFFGPQ